MRWKNDDRKQQKNERTKNNMKEIIAAIYIEKKWWVFL